MGWIICMGRDSSRAVRTGIYKIREPTRCICILHLVSTEASPCGCTSTLGGKFQIPNSKWQIPNGKFQTPNGKFQMANSKFQIPNKKNDKLQVTMFGF